MINKLFYSAFAIFISATTFSQNNDSLIIHKIYSEALENGKAYDWLRELTSDIGGRLSGSPEAVVSFTVF